MGPSHRLWDKPIHLDISISGGCALGSLRMEPQLAAGGGNVVVFSRRRGCDHK